MKWIEWVFSGIGTQILSFIVGTIIGYKVGVKNSFRQMQKAGDNAKQIQVGKIKDAG